MKPLAVSVVAFAFALCSAGRAADAQAVGPHAPTVVIGPPQTTLAPLTTATFATTGAPQTVNLLAIDAHLIAPGPQLACETPCTLRVPVGSYAIAVQSTRDGANFTDRVDVPAQGIRVRITPNGTGRLGGAALFAFGAGALPIAILLASSAANLDAANRMDRYFNYDTTGYWFATAFATSIGLGVIPGAFLLNRACGRIHTSAPRAAPALLVLGAAPMPGGAAIVAVARF